MSVNMPSKSFFTVCKYHGNISRGRCRAEVRPVGTLNPFSFELTEVASAYSRVVYSVIMITVCVSLQIYFYC